MSQPLFKAVLYDFDGTLVDTAELIMSCYRHTMSTHLGHVPPEEEWLAGFGTPLQLQLGRYARSPEEHEAMLDTYRSFQEVQYERVLRPFESAVETVTRLEAAGLALAIVTSRYQHSTVRGLEVCGLTQHFRVVVTPEDVTHAKPHPEPVLLALDQLGVRPDQALFVGDSPHDIVAGREAGTKTAAALWGPFSRDVLEEARPDFFIAAQEEVLSLVGLPT